MGETNKLLAQIDGKSLLQHVISNLIESNIDKIVVVIGHESEKIIQHISHSSIVFAKNDDFKKGLSSSIKAGVAKIQSSADAVLIVHADMPFVEAGVINKIVNALNNHSNIVIPRYKQKDGNPLLWPSEYFGQLKQLTGDQGAKQILGGYLDKITYVDVDNIGILVDIDDPSGLKFFQTRFNKS